jgi:GR25 family glycosyltransferase involved in LPS biosynthesis
MIEQNIEKAIVIEDDMLLNNDFVDIYKFLVEKKVTEEIIQIYYRGFNEIKFSGIDSLLINSKFNIVKPYSLNDIPVTTGCYYITRYACVKLVKIISPIKATADSWKYFIINSDFDNLKSVFPRPICKLPLIRTAYYYKIRFFFV